MKQEQSGSFVKSVCAGWFYDVLCGVLVWKTMWQSDADSSLGVWDFIHHVMVGRFTYVNMSITQSSRVMGIC